MDYKIMNLVRCVARRIQFHFAQSHDTYGVFRIQEGSAINTNTWFDENVGGNRRYIGLTKFHVQCNHSNIMIKIKCAASATAVCKFQRVEIVKDSWLKGWRGRGFRISDKEVMSVFKSKHADAKNMPRLNIDKSISDNIGFKIISKDVVSYVNNCERSNLRYSWKKHTCVQRFNLTDYDTMREFTVKIGLIPARIYCYYDSNLLFRVVKHEAVSIKTIIFHRQNEQLHRTGWEKDKDTRNMKFRISTQYLSGCDISFRIGHVMSNVFNISKVTLDAHKHTSSKFTSFKILSHNVLRMKRKHHFKSTLWGHKEYHTRQWRYNPIRFRIYEL